MATAESTGANRHLDEDRLVRSLVPDPVQVPDVKVLVGFLGRSARAGYWRLYFTAELDHYCDFREEDVVHSVSLETDQNPLGGTAVWVNREANVLYTRTRSREAQADFLRGDIAAASLKQMHPRGLGLQQGTPAFGPFSLIPPCPGDGGGPGTILFCPSIWKGPCFAWQL